MASPPANIHATPIIARLPAWTRPDLLLLTISMRNDICPIVEDGHQHHDRQHHVEFDGGRVDEASKVPSHHQRDSLSLIVPYGVAALRPPVQLLPLHDKKKICRCFCNTTPFESLHHISDPPHFPTRDIGRCKAEQGERLYLGR